jgi:hypothetical protein
MVRPDVCSVTTSLTLGLSCGIFNQNFRLGPEPEFRDIPMTYISRHILISVITGLAWMVSFSTSRATSTLSAMPLVAYSQS